MKKSCLTLLICLLSINAYCNFDWNQNCQSAYSEIMQLKFKSGKARIKLEKQNNPNNKLPYLIEDYIDYLKIQVGEEKSEFEKLKVNKNLREKQLKKGDSNSAWFLFSQAELHIHWAANRMKFKEYFTAAYEIKKAYSLLIENNKKFPDFIANKKSLGLLHTLIGSVPENYKWILSIIGMEGSINLGMSELESVIKHAKENKEYSYLLEETYFYYALLKINLQNDIEGLKKLVEEIKNSEFLILNFATNRIANKIGDNELAISVLENRIQTEEHFSFLYLDLLIGVSKLNQLDYSAKAYFENYLSNYKGENFLKSANMRLSWIHFLEGNFEEFKLSQEKINSIGNTLIDVDKEAQKEFDQNFVPNKQLLKARLLFDGGKYEESLKELKKIGNPLYFSNTKFITEYYYRTARVNEVLQKTAEAKKNYIKTIEIGLNQKHYFAAKSALQLALIFEREENLAQAKNYFQACLDMKNHEYEYSLEQKAEAGLNRLSN